MIKEFKDFAIKGSVIDMAVGIIIGGTFATITKTLVADVIMPPICILLGGIDLSNLFITLQDGEKAAGPYASLVMAQEAGAVTMNIGSFLDSVVTFTIVAFVVFMLIRQINKLKAATQKAKEEAPPAPLSEDILLLQEIRDSLKKL